MKYQVFSRKYRPQTFREVVGQEAAVATLKNALRFERSAHAYLFCGCRGVGKTTLARLFAKALNCQNIQSDFEPCNNCPSCLEILSGQSLDVIEIDGASNRGIDDIRQINETIGYAPSHGKYKIYIIDEVHMLTKEAFNALLKTLEEPPERAKFFFATTESHKVLPTIISRCQRFDLGRIQLSQIVSKLQQIAQDVNREAEAEALRLIAHFADGSLRDAESLFDQILCFATGSVTVAVVRQSLGLVPQEIFFALDKAFSEMRLSFAFELTEQLFQSGKDLAHFLEQLIEHYRNIALFRTVPDSSSYNASAKLYTQPQSLNILEFLIQAEAQFQRSPFQRIALESILLQILRTKNKIPIEVLIRRLENLENKPTEKLPEKEIPLQETSPIPETKKETLPPPQEELKKESVPLSKLEKIPLPIETFPLPQEESKKEPVLKTVSLPKLEETLPPIPEMKKEAVLPLEPKKEPVLKAVPFNPFVLKQTPPLEIQPGPKIEQSSPSVQKHGSYYETLMRFAAVELEGTIKLN